jgi:hypothetical protein
MNINEMSKKDFEQLPCRKWNEDIGEFDSLVILPGRAKPLHGSGYRLMDFVAVRSDKAICRLSGCSDVIHINGIGGYGDLYSSPLPKTLPVMSWNIDCLPKSGLLRLWCVGYELHARPALSSFEIIAKRQANNDRTTANK